jgi:8-oxo-dGTP diphosphatase
MKRAERPTQADGRLHGVVVGVRREDGRWLMVRRSRHVVAPGRVCFPGGAIEVGESQEEAVVREMKEELGVRVRPLRNVWRWDAPDRPLTLWGWVAVIESGEIAADPKEIEEVLWLTGDEGSRHVNGLPTNVQFIACLSNDPGEGP